MQLKRVQFLNGNALKIIGAICMLIDHVGFMFFPSVNIFRIIGRISFPIFAFMIAEGTKYTKNKIRYFSVIFILALAFQIVYYVVAKSLYMGVLVTFSLSIIIIYALNNFKNQLFTSKSIINVVSSAIILVLTVLAVYYANTLFTIDYGFIGCIIAPIVSLFHFKNVNKNGDDSKVLAFFKKLDVNILHVLMLAIALLIFSLLRGGNQIYSLISIPLLCLYNGTRGKLNLKYFFYIFYPAHLVILYAIEFFI